MTQYDDPNREAIGLEPAWVEGSGGAARKAKAEPAKADDKADKAEPKADDAKAKPKS